MTLNTGDLLHKRYFIEKIIARGGMGAVYQAVDRSLNIQVAVKENLIVAEESSKQFHLEATMLAALRHPNLPRVTDHFIITDQGEYLVMDFIEGTDLRDSLKQSNALPVDRVIKIGATVCDALSYLHSRQPPIVHRDIKPANIKLTSEGHLYLVDFGLAKINIEGEATATGAKSLTPGYAPPEQYGKGTDARSDIYGLGATLYTACTKSLPEDGLARLVGATELTPIRKIRPEVPVYLATAIEKAISVDRAQRFQNIEEFKAAILNQPLPVTAVSVVSAPVQSPPSLQVQNNGASSTQDHTFLLPREKQVAPKKFSLPLIVTLIGFAILFIGIVSVISLIQIFSNPPVSVIPVLQNANLTGTPTMQATLPIQSTPKRTASNAAQIETIQAVIPVLNTPTLAVTPPGGGSGQIIFTSERSGKPQVWMMKSDGTAQHQVTNLADGACQADLSPDGKKMIVTSPCSGQKETYQGSSLFFINADGSGLIPIPSIPGGDFDPAWSPDGTRIAFTSIRNGSPNIYLMNLSDKSVKRISRSNIIERRPVWSPDGKHLAFESARLGQNQIWVINPDDGLDAVDFTSSSSAAFNPAWSPDGKVIIFSQGSSQPWLAAKQYPEASSPEMRISDIRPALQPEYSPDGFWLAFVGKTGDKTDIYRMMTNGGNLTRLTNDASADYDPIWVSVAK